MTTDHRLPTFVSSHAHSKSSLALNHISCHHVTWYPEHFHYVTFHPDKCFYYTAPAADYTVDAKGKEKPTSQPARKVNNIYGIGGITWSLHHKGFCLSASRSVCIPIGIYVQVTYSHQSIYFLSIHLLYLSISRILI